VFTQGEDISSLPFFGKDLNMMSKLWKRHHYDLPADFSLYMAVVVLLVFVFTPASPSLPISQIIALGFVIYFSAFVPGPNKLELSLSINSKAWRAILVIIALTLIILLLTMILMTIAKSDYSEALKNEEIWQQESFEFIGSWAPDKSIHESLYQKNLTSVIKYAVKPFLGLVIFASVFETIIIFGVLFPVIWRRNGYYQALFGVPFVFALLHILQTSPLGFVIIYISGLVQALLYAKTKSLYPAIILHICWNLNILLFLCFLNWGLPYQ